MMWWDVENKKQIKHKQTEAFKHTVASSWSHLSFWWWTCQISLAWSTPRWHHPRTLPLHSPLFNSWKNESPPNRDQGLIRISEQIIRNNKERHIWISRNRTNRNKLTRSKNHFGSKERFKTDLNFWSTVPYFPSLKNMMGVFGFNETKGSGLTRNRRGFVSTGNS